MEEVGQPLGLARVRLIFDREEVVAVSVDYNHQSSLVLALFGGTFYCYVHASPVPAR